MEDIEKKITALDKGKKQLAEHYDRLIEKYEKLNNEASDERTKEIFNRAIELTKQKKKNYLKAWDEATKKITKTKTFTVDAILVDEQKKVENDQSEIEQETLKKLVKQNEQLQDKINELYKATTKISKHGNLKWVIGMIGSAMLFFVFLFNKTLVYKIQKKIW